ncbi:MAG: redoxin domain-containing protein [Gemmatimonadota bacterium]|jgi:peroxiredoxin
MTQAQWRWFRRLEITLWVLAIGAIAWHYRPAQAVARVAQNEVAPSFSLRTLEGDKVRLDDLRGNVVLVNFWATWCPPCRLEMPGFESVYRDYRGRGFTVVGLATDVGGAGVVEPFVQQNGITYPVAMATDQVRLQYGGVNALPQSFLLDRQGRVRQMVAGVFSEGTLRKAVDQLLAESDGP